jgi:hypothetical protein
VAKSNFSIISVRNHDALWLQVAMIQVCCSCLVEAEIKPGMVKALFPFLSKSELYEPITHCLRVVVNKLGVLTSDDNDDSGVIPTSTASKRRRLSNQDDSASTVIAFSVEPAPKQSLPELVQLVREEITALLPHGQAPSDPNLAQADVNALHVWATVYADRPGCDGWNLVGGRIRAWLAAIDVASWQQTPAWHNVAKGILQCVSMLLFQLNSGELMFVVCILIMPNKLCIVVNCVCYRLLIIFLQLFVKKS